MGFSRPSRWRQIRIAAAKEQLELPSELPAEGLIINENHRQKFGCWIMPDNAQSGSIEAVLLGSTTGALQLSWRDHATKFVETVPNPGFPNKVAARQKATLRAWTAIQAEPIWVPSFAVKEALLLPQLDAEYPLVRWLIALKNLL